MGMWRLAAIAAASVFLASSAANADWVVKDTTSQLDNTRSYTAHLTSTNQVPNSIGRPDTAALVVRCKGGELSVYVVWPAFMGTEGETVKWKFDNGEIWQQDWNNSEDGTATFARDERKFLTDMATASKLVIDAPPYQSDNAEAVFDLKGAADVVKTALAACPA